MDPNSDRTTMWRTHGERVLYDNRWVRLTQVDVEPPDGNRFWHHVVHLPPIAAAVVLDDQERVLLLWRHRFVTDSFGWELPGGIIEKDETGAAAAVREVVEETGWRPTGTPEHLVSIQPMPGMVNARHEVYVIHGATRVGLPTETQETGEIAWVPLAQIPALLRGNQIASAGSLVGLLHYLALHRPERCLQPADPLALPDRPDSTS
jgi:8-oxo-dGTP pyrophosphatase MutT (NUDIX family)